MKKLSCAKHVKFTTRNTEFETWCTIYIENLLRQRGKLNPHTFNCFKFQAELNAFHQQGMLINLSSSP